VLQKRDDSDISGRDIRWTVHHGKGHSAKEKMEEEQKVESSPDIGYCPDRRCGNCIGCVRTKFYKDRVDEIAAKMRWGPCTDEERAEGRQMWIHLHRCSRYHRLHAGQGLLHSFEVMMQIARLHEFLAQEEFEPDHDILGDEADE
jgi:hypothetical protein